MKDQPIAPKTAARLAAEDDSNSLSGAIPKLAHLLEHIKDLEVAYLCDQSAVQVSKLWGSKGQWCGYRNIQMLCLALQSALSPSAPLRQKLKGGKPTVPELQAMIEGAWDQGINPHGRTQLGGIIGTAKYIGTSEAEALLLSLAIPCTGQKFEGKHAWSEVMDSVEEYYSASITLSSKTVKTKDDAGRAHITSRPPIFLQRPGHSVTIVGTARLQSGERSLLIFDPAWSAPASIRKDEHLTCEECKGLSARWVLRQYMKSERWLSKWKTFETLSVDLPPREACWR
ncbi:hypothetical protein LTR10_009583 [Elasticomyces elasticus]|nr:hypothetical protein LTR10_009583 [Elasticomyces elasticus]KAK4971322.1 hypothetical protein LTR42_007048 [Elasticomyces elasticus]